jgi:hypothetical protein
MSRTAVPVIYTVGPFRQAYTGTWLAAGARTAFVMTSYIIVIAVVTLLLVVFIAHYSV